MNNCQCGSVIFADTESWTFPVCYQCYIEKRNDIIGLLELENENLKDCLLEAMEINEPYHSNNLKETYKKIKEQQ